MNPPSLNAAQSRPRSVFTTVLAWLMMISGIIGLPISFITVLMLIAKSYGTKTSNPIGFCIVVLGPAVLVVSGFAMLRRWWWARGATIGLLAMVIADNAWGLIKGPRPSTTTYDASGVPTTVMGSGTNYTVLPIIAMCAGVMTKLFSSSARDEFDEPPSMKAEPFINQRSWRVGHRGRDMMYYEELVNGRWERIDVDGEMLMGRAHHVIYFATAERWKTYPEWARHRRIEIIDRIKSEFRVPDYEYQGDA